MGVGTSHIEKHGRHSETRWEVGAMLKSHQVTEAQYMTKQNKKE